MPPRPIPVSRRAAPAARRDTLRAEPDRAGRSAPGRAGRTERDRGATPVELAIVMPAILVLLFASIQAAAWFVARSTALNAAQSGVSAERVYQADAGAGEASATRFLRQAGDWLVGWEEQRPTCVRTPAINPTEVSCTVRGRGLSVIPMISWEVDQTAHGTVERWTTGGGP